MPSTIAACCSGRRGRLVFCERITSWRSSRPRATWYAGTRPSRSPTTCSDKLGPRQGEVAADALRWGVQGGLEEWLAVRPPAPVACRPAVEHRVPATVHNRPWRRGSSWSIVVLAQVREQLLRFRDCSTGVVLRGRAGSWTSKRATARRSA